MVKWARGNKGTLERSEIRCRLVAQLAGYGGRLDELFAGALSLMFVAFELVLLDVKCVCVCVCVPTC